jgi:hypothetical protein
LLNVLLLHIRPDVLATAGARSKYPAGLSDSGRGAAREDVGMRFTFSDLRGFHPLKQT